jgi:hypothetical protein
VNGRSRAESQVGVRLMGVWRVSYSNIQEFFFFACCLLRGARQRVRVRRQRVSISACAGSCYCYC